MKKISTLFKKDPNNLSRVINEIDPQNNWVFDPGVKATRKFDGSACAIINGHLYKRYDVKKGRQVPENAIPCQEPDPITGHWPHWLLCDRNKPEDKFFFEAFDRGGEKADGTYELVGPKVQGNPEKFTWHELIKHGSYCFEFAILPCDTKAFILIIKNILQNLDAEGIVFHHPDGRMCKIRKSDFGIKR